MCPSIFNSHTWNIIIWILSIVWNNDYCNTVLTRNTIAEFRDSICLTDNRTRTRDIPSALYVVRWTHRYKYRTKARRAYYTVGSARQPLGRDSEYYYSVTRSAAVCVSPAFDVLYNIIMHNEIECIWQFGQAVQWFSRGTDFRI